jgi:arylsulfatase A-like enzyme/Tfp pilus assembly protein PilF
MHRLRIAVCAAFMAALGMAYTVQFGHAEAASPRPSVLLVTLDTTRADRLGCYGSKRKLTPALDEFAKTCVIFDHCEAPIPQTVPSHTTILSGWDPPRHGVRKNLEVLVPDTVPMIQKDFKAAGYRTGAFVSSFVLLGHFGLGRGFDAYDDAFYDRKRPEVVERSAQETLDRAMAWIKAQKGPWFCWVHLYDPHTPYAPPAPFDSRYPKSPYDGEVAYMDRCLGGFFSELGGAGLFEDTLVAVCADHGESLGDHGEDTHSIFLYESTTHVPLMVHLPGQKAPRRVSEDVGLVDLAPSLRKLCSLKDQPGDGVPLEPLLSGGPVRRPGIYMESLEGLYSFGWAPLYGLVENRRKFILAPRSEFYDLGKDPGETTDLSKTQAAQASKMKAELQRRIASAPKVSAQKAGLGSEELKSLQSLGYIGGTTGKAGASYRDPKEGKKILALHTRAVDDLQQGRAAQAAKGFEEILKLDPKNPLAYYYAAHAREVSDPDRAVTLYKKAIQMRPDFPQAYLRLIGLLEDRGKAQEAYRLCGLALKQTEDYSGELHVLAAWAAFETGRPEVEVRGFLDEAVKLGPERGISFKLKAIMALKKGDRDGAMRALDQMAKTAPPNMVAALGGDGRFKELKGDERFWKLVIQANKEGKPGP